MARIKSAAPALKPRRNQLVQAAMLLKQASDPTRLRVLMILAGEERNVGQLVKALGLMSQPAVSHHLALLRHGGLIEPRRDGKNNFYSLTEKGMQLCRAIEAVTAS
jgi:DNA-binding transcriptional ArsR family regulator